MGQGADKPAQESQFDPDALRERYLLERDRRLREDGNEQYIEVLEQFAHFLEDPYGATSVQCVPMVAEWAEQLLVFQRTLSSIDVRNNPPTDAGWAESLQPG